MRCGRMGLDTSDPYAMLRVGTIGSNFHDKDEDMDRVSGIVMGTLPLTQLCKWMSQCSPRMDPLCIFVDSLNPEWNFACRFTLPEGVDRTKLELHIVCQDKDIFTSDDPLGEVCLLALASPLASGLGEHTPAHLLCLS